MRDKKEPAMRHDQRAVPLFVFQIMLRDGITPKRFSEVKPPSMDLDSAS